MVVVHAPGPHMTNGASSAGEARPGASPPPPPAARFVEPAVEVRQLLDRLEREHAVAVPALTPGYRAWLLEEARAAPYREARPVVGRGARLVRQRMGVYDDFGSASRFHDLAGAYQALWDAWLAPMAPCPFESRLVFNDWMLQVYEPGEIGITPHMDRTSYRNLICLFVLEGRGRFGVCEDRSGGGGADRRPRARRRGAHPRAGVQGLRSSPVPFRGPHHRAAATCSGCGTNAAVTGNR